jgi:broad specificity phosphatase PhoE
MTSEERQSQTPKSIRKISSSILMKTPIPPSRQGSSSVHRHGATLTRPTAHTPPTRTMTTPNNTTTAHIKLSHTKQTIASYRESTASSKILQSKTPKRLYLIRHGQSMGQIATKLGMDRKRDSRLLDAGLTELGVQQAQQLTQLWKNVNHTTRIIVDKESPRGNKGYNINHHQHLHHDDDDDDGNADDNHDTTQYSFLEKYASPDLVISSPLTRAIHTALLGFPGRKIVLCSELAEIGSYSPENTLRSITEIRNDLMGKSHPPFLPMETTTTTTTIAAPIQWNVDHSRISTTSRNTNTTKIATTSQSPYYYESKRNRIQAIRRFLRYLYTERSEECIAVVCHYNVIQCIMDDDSMREDASSTKITTMTNNTIRPQNATPILCDLYANGRVVPCEKSFVSSSNFGEERKRLDFENIN